MSQVDPENRSPTPICLRNDSLWSDLQAHLRLREVITPRRAKLASDSVYIYLESVKDFRYVTSKLDTEGVEYSTNQLRQDRELVVVSVVS